MAARYWLMKSEPGEYSLDDLKKEPDQTEHWDGVRNYQARNFMRDNMQVGDGVLFYHSGKKPEVVGTARIVKTGYPDHTAWDPKNNHYDPKSTPETPIWYMVDIKFESEFKAPIPLKELREVPALIDMILLRRGNRLSVMPVTKKEFDTIVKMGK
ncbi:MAG: EVE domain-containing protein [Deltaproteobacteria bacterium]|nr:EVE domain-containing protein [Deltaproteobacteria bacterium]